MSSSGSAEPRLTYLDGPPRQVPGFASLHRMVGLLLAERMPENGRVLVLGAGGGMEIKALAEAHAGWFFVGIDPSREMLELAADTVRPHAHQVTWHQGYIDSAPQGPFDGAVSLLTFHFIPRAQRLATLQAIHARLKPGAPLVVAHISIAETEPERSLWLSRHLAFSGTTQDNAQHTLSAMRTQLSIVAPQADEAFLREAGFHGVDLFYAGFSFRGWVAYA